MKFKQFTFYLRIVLIIIFIYFLISLIPLFKGFFSRDYIDFPCEAEVTSQGCLNYRGDDFDISKDFEIEAFITIYEAGVRGAGCIHRGSKNKKLDFQGLTFERADEIVKLSNGVMLAEDNQFIRKRILKFWNPWRLKKEKFTIQNKGIVTCYIDKESGLKKSYGPTMVLIGEYATFYKANTHGIISLIILIIIFIFTFVFKQSKKSDIKKPKEE